MNPLDVGRELDAIIAAEVMGLTVKRDWPCGDEFMDGTLSAASSLEERAEWPHIFDQRHPVYVIQRAGGGEFLEPVPFYSTDITDAWLVVKKLSMWVCPADDAHSWAAGVLGLEEPSPEAGVWAETVEHAICLAALESLYDYRGYT